MMDYEKLVKEIYPKAIMISLPAYMADKEEFCIWSPHYPSPEKCLRISKWQYSSDNVWQNAWENIQQAVRNSLEH